MAEKEPDFDIPNSPIDALYRELDSYGKLAIDGTRNLTEYYVEKNDPAGLKTELENKQSSPLYLIKDKEIRKEVAKLLSAEIREKFRAKKAEAQAENKPGKSKSQEVKKEQSENRAIKEARDQLENQYLEISQEQKEILDEVDKRGRLITNTSVNVEIAEDRGTGTGFQWVADKKEMNQGMNELLNNVKYGKLFNFSIEKDFSTHAFRELLKKENINVAITMVPLLRETPVYEETKEKTGWIFKKEHIVKKQTSVTSEPVSIGELNNNTKDAEVAYRIIFYVQGTENKGYREGAGMRFGVHFYGNIILPKDIARKTFSQIEKDVDFAKKVLETLDPQLMKPEKERMPKLEKGEEYLVVPPGEALEAFERTPGLHGQSNPYFTATSINPDYKKRYTK